MQELVKIFCANNHQNSVNYRSKPKVKWNRKNKIHPFQSCRSPLNVAHTDQSRKCKGSFQRKRKNAHFKQKVTHSS